MEEYSSNNLFDFRGVREGRDHFLAVDQRLIRRPAREAVAWLPDLRGHLADESPRDLEVRILVLHRPEFERDRREGR